MAVHLRVLLILSGFTGIHSITTVSEVSVKAGSSISIPCLYGLQYISHVKYLCKGFYWHSCSYIVKTNQQNSGRFSISDDNTRRIFTVTINDLADEDTDYWCAVEINGGADVKEYFHLSVTGDTPHLYVDHQEITRLNGDNLTINCYYTNTGETKWCRLGISCVTRSSGSIDGTKVTISEGAHSVFNVTMSGLRTESSGWYWCAKGDLKMPVHVTVTETPTTTTIGTRHLTTLSPTPNHILEDGQQSAYTDPKSLIISLSLLISIVMVALLIWFMLRRHKQTKAESSATTTAEEELTYSIVKHKTKTSSQAEEEETQCNVGNMRKTSSQRSESDVEVIYSSVITIKQQTVKRAIVSRYLYFSHFK
ncbi:uncharacterized protein LOC116054989 isoform X2 [Sander lucioperca]|uniref:uncharacterized protein LOC116054989 isoform X2 n=1 Tax=Sander lucioperca TaxID=283035 RepID=UPI001653B3C5|nr:uncharacterized protein LOC116054989 isoform X2 [Sander lucioperca]